MNRSRRMTATQTLQRTIMGAMRKAGRSANENLFPVKTRKPAPYAFVLDAISQLPIETRSMFGCLAVYVGDKIVLMLREKQKQVEDNGVWLATTKSTTRVCAASFPTCDLSSNSGRKSLAGRFFPPMHLISSQRRCVPAN